MRVSLDFEEIYHDPRGPYARYRRAGLLDPSEPGEEPETVVGFIAGLKKGRGTTAASITTPPPTPMFWASSSRALPGGAFLILLRSACFSRSAPGRMPMSRSIEPARRARAAAST
ncbi:hypothetical protein MesoLj131c_52850 [Mesorhizobium sp. 131-3-5]|nr:hypothetical protein MesoLj131c_52850 [Mesorhizobium sp. 131-3-5]